MKIGIIGCGWLGLPLAEFLAKRSYTVVGTTTDREKLEVINGLGIKAVLLNIKDTVICENIELINACDCLVINFPPRRVENIEELYLHQNKQLLKSISLSNIKHVIFISSTSVYNDNTGLCKESDELLPTKKSGKALKMVEELYLQQSNTKTTILRMAGLIGYNRNPANFMSGKQNVPNGDAPVNLVHRDDCVRIIYEIIHKNIWGEIYNVCADKHPTRKEFYTLAAEKFNVALPTFSMQQNGAKKIIDNTKIRQELNYRFLYPDPLSYIIKKSENKADIE